MRSHARASSIELSEEQLHVFLLLARVTFLHGIECHVRPNSEEGYWKLLEALFTPQCDVMLLIDIRDMRTSCPYIRRIASSSLRHDTSMHSGGGPLVR